MLRLPTMATTSPIRRLTFCYEYVVGYGNWGADVPAEVTGPSFTVSIVDDATGEASVVYESPELFEFDYDTCNDNGGWGDDTIVGPSPLLSQNLYPKRFQIFKSHVCSSF